MINDDLDEVSWYSTRRWFTHAHERCVTERERVCVDCQLSRNAVPNHATVTRLSKPTAHKLPH